MYYFIHKRGVNTLIINMWYFLHGNIGITANIHLYIYMIKTTHGFCCSLTSALTSPHDYTHIKPDSWEYACVHNTATAYTSICEFL